MKSQYAKFAANLKDLRLRRHILQSQLANALGITQAALSQYENGDRFPPIDKLEAIADYFNISISALTDNQEYTTEESEALSVADKLLQTEDGRNLALFLKNCDEDDIRRTLEIVKILKNGSGTSN